MPSLSRTLAVRHETTLRRPPGAARAGRRLVVGAALLLLLGSQTVASAHALAHTGGSDGCAVCHVARHDRAVVDDVFSLERPVVRRATPANAALVPGHPALPRAASRGPPA